MAKNLTQKRINLLSSDYLEPKKYQKINKLSFGILGVYLLLILMVFGYFLFLTFQKNQLSQENLTLVSEVERQKEKEGLLVVLKNRINVAKSIFSKSSPSASDLVNSIVSLLPANVTLVSVSADRDGKVLLVVTSPDSQGIAQMITILEDKKFAGVALNTLALNTEQDYVLSLDIRP